MKYLIVILATHIVSDIEYIANKIILLNNGTITDFGTQNEITEKINGKVWEFVCDSREVLEIMNKMRVSNVVSMGEKCKIRAVCDEKPDENAAECFHFYKSIGNDYEAEKYAMAYEMYQNRQIPEYRATYWTKLFFGQEFSSLLCIIMLILGLSNAFTSERESGMFRIIGSSGKSKSTTLAKTASAAVYCLLLSVYFTIGDLATADILLGVERFDMPLYSAKMFKNTPFSFSFAETIPVWIAAKFFALFVVALMILFASKISPNTIVAFVLSFGIALVLIFLTAVSKSILNPFNIIVPTSLVEEFSVMNIFGQPVITLWAAIIAGAVECVVLCVLNTFIGQKSRR